MTTKYLSLIDGLITEVEANASSSGLVDAGKIVALDENGRLDQTFMPVGIGADTLSALAFESLEAGNFVYITQDGMAAKASAIGNAAVGFILSNADIGQEVLVYFEGRNTSLSVLTIGSRYYLSEIAGLATDVPVSGTGKKHQYLGNAISQTTLSYEAADYVVLA
jgi:hypothetical protein